MVHWQSIRLGKKKDDAILLQEPSIVLVKNPEAMATSFLS